MDADGFDWDAGNLTKCQKHGVTIDEIETLLRGDPRIAPDLKHSGSEPRSVAIGRNNQGRAVFVVFTIRVRSGRTLIRPLSSRYMHNKEIEGYEEEEH
jgi:uncharacterized DUF497 family protein